MKKIILVIAAAVLSAGSLFAQDMAHATETYNSGATALAEGNKTSALEFFQQALDEGQKIGADADELVNNCKTTIPKILLSLSKDSVKEAKFDEALASLDKTIAKAKEYGAEDVANEATELIPQVYMQKGNTLLKAKDAAGAAEAYKKVTELNPANGQAYLRLGAALNASGDAEGAEAAFTAAMANGQEKDAKSQLSKMYLKKAQAALKAGKNAEVLTYAAKSNEYVESANAYKLAASAAQKLKKNDEVIANYEKYLELAPNAKDAAGVNYTLAVIYQQAGNKEKAKEYYNKVLTDATYGAGAKAQLEALNK